MQQDTHDRSSRPATRTERAIEWLLLLALIAIAVITGLEAYDNHVRTDSRPPAAASLK